MSAKDTPLAELLQRPWSRQVAADEDGVFIASVPELEGCFAEGSSAAEALANLDQVIKEWLEIALEDDVPIAAPRRLRDTDYSGRFSVRVPRSLHRELSEWALEEEISLNQFISTVLARAVARRPIVEERTGESIQDAYEQVAAAAVMGGAESIGALKGIGAYLRQAGMTNLACVLFALLPSVSQWQKEQRQLHENSELLRLLPVEKEGLCLLKRFGALAYIMTHGISAHSRV